jgi:hypothetical protein
MKQGTDPLRHAIYPLVNTLPQLLFPQLLCDNNNFLMVMRSLLRVLHYFSEVCFLHRPYIDDCIPVIDNVMNGSFAHSSFLLHFTKGMTFRL